MWRHSIFSRGRGQSHILPPGEVARATFCRLAHLWLSGGVAALWMYGDDRLKVCLSPLSRDASAFFFFFLPRGMGLSAFCVARMLRLFAVCLLLFFLCLCWMLGSWFWGKMLFGCAVADSCCSPLLVPGMGFSCIMPLVLLFLLHVCVYPLACLARPFARGLVSLIDFFAFFFAFFFLDSHDFLFLFFFFFFFFPVFIFTWTKNTLDICLDREVCFRLWNLMFSLIWSRRAGSEVMRGAGGLET
jgi:hypothetical protein